MNFTETALTHFKITCGGKDFGFTLNNDITTPMTMFLAGDATGEELIAAYIVVGQKVGISPQFLDGLATMVNACSV